MTLRPLALLFLLSACETTPATDSPPPANAMIEVASGSFFGSSATQIFADGRIIQFTGAPGHAPTQVAQQGTPDAYTAAAAVIAAEGRHTKATQKIHAEQCLDYGSDSVRAVPPIGGFDGVSTGCPDAAVTALMDHVLSSLATKNVP